MSGMNLRDCRMDFGEEALDYMIFDEMILDEDDESF